jgi:hypothetical protein
LLANVGVEQHYDVSDEVDELLVYQFRHFLVFIDLTSGLGLHAAN